MSRCTHYGLKLILFAVCGEGHAKCKLKVETSGQGKIGASSYNTKHTFAQERNEVAALLVSHSAHQSVHKITVTKCRGFGGLGVACCPLVPKFTGSNPAEVVGFLGRKNPQHAFLRRESKAVGPMS